MTSSTINFQARLQGSSGAIVADGYYNVQFKLYTASAIDGGETPIAGSCTTNPGAVADEDCLWTETHYDSNGVTAGNDNRIRVQNGYLSAALGSRTAFPSTINWDQELWLTMNIGGVTQTATPTWDGEMSPRLALTAVPYAFKAGQLAKQTGSYQSTLGFDTQTGSRSLLLPDESGTLCIRNSTACGFAAASGSGSYINNGTGQQAGANFNISGSGTIGGGASISGGLNNNSGGVTNAGSIAGVTTLSGSGNITSTAGVLSIQGTGNNYMAGRLGLGNATPFDKLDVIGNTRVSGVLYSNNMAGNIFADGGFEYYSSELSTPTTGVILNSSANARTGNAVYRMTGNSNVQDAVRRDYIQVTPGQQYYLEGWRRTEAGYNGDSHGALFIFVDKDFANPAYDAVGTLFGAQTTWTKFSGTVTVPAGKYFMTFGPSVRSNATTGNIYFDDFYMTRGDTPGGMQVAGAAVLQGGLNVTGGIDNNSGGITEAGSIAGVTTLNASGNITSTAGVLSMQGTGNNYFAGKVGVGTNAPGSYQMLIQGTAATNILGVTDGTVTLGMYTNNGSTIQGQIGTVSNHHLGFFANNQSPQLTLSTAGNVGIGTNRIGGYKLDVDGSVNVTTGNSYKINGTDICTASGCITASGSGSYIQNGTGQQANSNFNISGSGTIAQDLTVNGRLKTSALTNGSQAIYVRGTGNNNNAARIVKMGSSTLVNGTGRGLTLTILTAATQAHVSSTNYDVYGFTADADAMATAMNNMTRAQIGIITSQDAWEGGMTANLRSAANRVGLYKLGSYSLGGSRRPYAAMFYGSGTATGNTETSKSAIEVMQGTDADAPYAIITTWLTEDGFIASGGTNALVSADSDAINPAVIVDSSSNVGIGTLQPGAYRLNVQGGDVIFSNALTTGGVLTVQAGGLNITGGIDNNSGGITEAGAIAGATTIAASTSITVPTVTTAGTLTLAATGANQILLQTNGTTRLTISSAGAATFSGTVSGTQLSSTVGNGTAPLTVNSTTKVTSLNVDQLDGIDSTGFILNQTGQQATSNFNISGTGIAGVAIQAPLIDTASAAALNIGTTNASLINLNKSVYLAAGMGFVANAGAGWFDMTSATGYFATSGGENYLNGNVTVLAGKTVGIGGNTTIQVSNSNNAFRVQNAGGSNLLKVDTALGRVFVGDGTTFYPKLTFGDYNATHGNNVWLAEYNNSDSDALQIQSKNGMYVSTGTTANVVMSMTGNGDMLFKGAADSATAFQVQDADGWSTVKVNTINNRVGLNLGTGAPDTTLDVNGAIQQTGMATPYSGATDNNKWTKLGTCSLTTQFSVCSSIINILGVVNNGGKSAQATLAARVEQSGAMGTAPTIGLNLTGALETISRDDLRTVTTVNNGTTTTVELYGRITTQYEQWYYSPTMNIPTWGTAKWLWSPTTPMITSLPVGTQTIASFGNTVLHGNTYIDTRNVTANTTIGVNPIVIDKAASAYFLNPTLNTNADVTTTYNITGVPNVEGTQFFISLRPSKIATANTRTQWVDLHINSSVATVAYEAVTSGNIAANVFQNFHVMYLNGAWRIMAQGEQDAETYDLAEWVPYTGTKPEAGELLSIGDAATSASVKQSSVAYDPTVVGVVTTNPGVLMGKRDPQSVRMALSGRVPVKVSLENGPIAPGDYLTASSTPGVAMKATQPGRIVGTAFTGYDGSGEASVMIQLSIGFAPPSASQDNQASINDLQQSVQQLQGQLNGLGTELNTLQLTAASLTVTGNAGIEGDLTVSGTTKLQTLELSGHLITKGAQPTLELQPAAGNQTPQAPLLPASVTIKGNDTSGTISVVAGDNATADKLVKIVFAQAFAEAPQVVITPVGKDGARLGAYVDGVTDSEFMLGATHVPESQKTYVFNYHVMQSASGPE